MNDPFSNWYSGIYYDPKNPANIRDLQYRQQFLRAAARYVPDFADSLFRAAVPIVIDCIKKDGSVPGPKSPGYREYSSTISAAIRQWMQRFNMETDWIFTEAYEIVMTGILYKEKGIDPLEAFGTWRREARPATGTRTFLLPEWDPKTESEIDYKKRANAAWGPVRDDYIRLTKAEATKAGLERIPAIRKRQVDLEMRFKWAVRHRCGGTPIDVLSEDCCGDTEVVRMSVLRILQNLGFKSPT